MKRNPRSFIALLMCMLTVLSAMVYNNASAAEGISKIDSYESLVERYGTATDDEGRTDGFVYIGTEFYEEDGNLTDYFVNPGDKLTVKVYLKSNMYTSDCKLISFFDNSFFDVKVVADGVSADNYDENGYIFMHRDGDINANHPMVTEHNMLHSVTTKDAVNAGWIANICGFEQEYLSSVDLVDNQSVIDVQTTKTPYEMTSDEWVFSYYVHVRDGLAEGTRGVVDSPEALWQSSICNIQGNPLYGKHDTRKQAKVPVRHKSEYVESASDFTQMAIEMDKGTLDHFIIEDMYHEFVIGEESQVTEPTYEPEETTYSSEYPDDSLTEFPTYIYPDEPSTEYPSLPVHTTIPSATPTPGVTASVTEIQIKTPSTNEIRYGDSIILHAVAKNVPEGAKIVWSTDNTCFSFSCSLDHKQCTIRPKESGSTVFTVKVIAENGSVICEDDVTMTAKAGTFWKIIAFFKQLFGLNRIIPEQFRTL